MPAAPWDNPDFDDYESRQADYQGGGDWIEWQAERDRSHYLDDLGWEDHADRGALGRRLPAEYQPPELAAPTARRKRFRFVEHHNGTSYVRTETGWLRDETPITLYTLTGRLDRQLEDRLRREDPDETDPRELVRRAWLAQAMEHPDRVEDLTTRALRALVGPPDLLRGGEVVPSGWKAEALAAAAMLSSALRQQKESTRALAQTDLFADDEYPPLMTSRAAALCDLDRWEDGRALAHRARDLQDSPELTHLIRRIDRHFSAMEQAHY